MKKRILCLLSAVFLLLSLMPIATWAATTVTGVDIAVTHPAHLEQPDGYLQVYGTGCKLDTSVNTNGFQNGFRWTKISSGKVLDATDTFEGDQLYELSVCLVADGGYCFSVSQTAVTVNTEEASFTIEDDTHIRVSIQLSAANLYITSVTVVGLDAPKTGNYPDYEVTVQEDTCSLTYSGYETCKNGVTWYDATDFQYLSIPSKFLAGHEYWAEIHLKANPGYCFPDDINCNVDGQWIASSGGGEVIALVVPFAPCEDHRWSPTYLPVDASGHAYICADCKAPSEILPHIAGPAGTPNAAVVCKDCGYIMTPEKNHTHELTLVPEVAPTCTEPGVKAYYTCSGCSDRFWDEKAAEVLPADADLSIPPQGHKISNEWGFNEETHWRICADCGEKMIETDMAHELKDDKCTTCDYSKKAPGAAEPAETTPTTAPADTQPDNEPEDQPWWPYLLIGVGCVVLGFGVGVIVAKLMKKKKG